LALEELVLVDLAEEPVLVVVVVVVSSWGLVAMVQRLVAAQFAWEERMERFLEGSLGEALA